MTDAEFDAALDAARYVASNLWRSPSWARHLYQGWGDMLTEAHYLTWLATARYDPARSRDGFSAFAAMHVKGRLINDARRRAVNGQTRWLRRTALPADLAWPAGHDEPAYGPALLAAVRRATARLPADMREVVRLRTGGLTSAQAAARLGVCRNWATTLWQRALVRLRDEMGVS